VTDVALLLVVPKKDVFINRIWVRFPVSAAGFFHHSGLSPAHPPYGCLGSMETSMAPRWARYIVASLLSPRLGLVGSE
jgi:hypothetical protein